MKGFNRIGIAAAAVCAFAVHSAAAQEPFSSVSLHLGVGGEFGDGQFHELWDTGPSVNFLVQMPFHMGDFEAGLAVARNESQGAAGADFLSALIHVGWGPSVDITPSIRAHAFVHAGDYFMMFDTRQRGYARRENELLLGGSGGLTFLLLDRVGVFARASYSRVFTMTEIDLFHLSAGISFRSSTPSWIRTLMR